MTPSEERKVLVAMSGGVDSSVAAALLLEAGYDVTGVFLCLATADHDEGRCCSPQDAADARRVAHALGIDLYVLNVAEAFRPIIEHFAQEYARGRTPNPCIHCNARIKFARLIRRADELGARYVATGHYAREARHQDEPALARGRAAEKDQSYALFAIARENLPRILLPIGQMAAKAEVRAVAERLGLDIHDKGESQEICFVPNDDYASLLRDQAPQAMTPGKIVSTGGKLLGEHDGYGRFTVGQRRGLRVAAGEPLYVTRIDPATATVTIGPRQELWGNRLTASAANWHCEVPESFDALVQIRANHRAAPAKVHRMGEERFTVEFGQDVWAITPGQAAVIYDGDVLLGGGWID